MRQELAPIKTDRRYSSSLVAVDLPLAHDAVDPLEIGSHSSSLTLKTREPSVGNGGAAATLVKVAHHNGAPSHCRDCLLIRAPHCVDVLKLAAVGL
eukprot:CAMPEP_0182922622 /NCGR_PEP_ID=MMETSP0105_2-20130417/4921_1 /TAXON_ID=81532 ORGANISM="Acanthoeca-like sp., Strain 10tr" /NCGR_SAMPLE_ID=MMETSP0105_2 /ASSEMBLY_ACC=CAM_ASM_000205 /LENGTH=95 /DNA_ID=CAMNT_0025060259 /DNA_START=101 /DNA_END=389 /DNA_ORIENTATION=+